MRISRSKIRGVCLIMILLLSASVKMVSAVPVDLVLLLLADISGSLTSADSNLQRTWYVASFKKATVPAIILSLPNGIAASLLYWSGKGQQMQVGGWTHITDAASASAFASDINAAGRAFSGSTGVTAAL